MQSPAKPALPIRLRGIDFLRGLGALGVVGFHNIGFGDAAGHVPVWFRALRSVLDQGHLGVALFFVVSGFCIHQRWAKNYANGTDANPAFVEFWKRRIHRLYPPYFVALLFSMAMVVTAYIVGANVPLLKLYPHPVTRSIVYDFAAHVTMLHGVTSTYDMLGGNPPYWSLAREEYLYLMYFALLWWRRRVGIVQTTVGVLLLGLLFSVAMGFRFSAGSGWGHIIYSSALVLWIQWTLGALAVEAHYGNVRLPRWCSSLWLFPLWFAAAFVVQRVPGVASVLWGMAFFTLLNYCIKHEKSRGWGASWVTRWITRVGVFSYSLYLVHLPVRIAVKYLLIRLGMPAVLPNYYAYTAVACGTAATGYFAGKVFYLIVERRFLNRAPVQRAVVVATVS